jgi:nicotinamide N-methyltransferase
MVLGLPSSLVAPSKPLLGHASPHSLTSRLRVTVDASPAQSVASSNGSRSGVSSRASNSTGDGLDEAWPEYLKQQQKATEVIYASPRHGDIKLKLANPAQSALGAHYVWDSALMMAELISEHLIEWGVEGKRVLELGTGSGLTSIVSVLCGAKEVVASDYPDSKLLANTRANVVANVPKGSAGRVSVKEHLWGCVDDRLGRENEHGFDVVVAAGCLWLEEQHVNIARSMAHFLKQDPDAVVYVVSGFFLGREKLEDFFQVAFEEGLNVLSMFEQDALGERRDCYVDCPDSKEETLQRGWLMVAQMGWHMEDDEEFEEEVQIEFKNLDNGITKKARPKSMLVRG